MLFLLSAAFLGWALYWSLVKRDVPDFIRKFFISQRSFNQKTDHDKPTTMAFYSIGLVICIGVATWFALSPFFRSLSDLFWPWFIAFIIMMVLVSNSFGNRGFMRIVEAYVDQENKDKLRAAYGAKGWAPPELLMNSLGNEGNGLHVGSHFTWNGQGHMMTVGGSRGGKGVNLILPALLANNLQMPTAPSFVVLDPKGENLAVAGNYLKKAGYDVLAVNPFAIPEIAQFGNSRFNPFDLFSGTDPDFDKYADMIAYALVPQTSHNNEFFDSSARNYITLYTRHMMTQDIEPKNFRTLYKWLRLAGPDRTNLLQEMSKSDAFDGDIRDEARAIAGQMLNDGGRTVEGIYSTVRTATDVFKDGQLRNSVSASDIDLKTLAMQKTAVFVCLSPADLDRCQAWLRLFFGSVMRGLTKYYNPARRVVLLMDEFPTLGALKEFETAAGFLAGYGVTLWPVMQDLTQLKNLYPNSWETFVNNAIVRHYLAVGDNFTADYISKRMPKELKFVGKNSDDTPREIQKPLLEPQEVMAWPNIIMEVKGVDRPGSLKKTPYWDINDNGSPNPFRS
jgi:type IV secretion system protein VirD4